MVGSSSTSAIRLAMGGDYRGRPSYPVAAIRATGSNVRFPPHLFTALAQVAEMAALARARNGMARCGRTGEATNGCEGYQGRGGSPRGDGGLRGAGGEGVAERHRRGDRDGGGDRGAVRWR